MNDATRRWGGVSALTVVVLGAAGAISERPWPRATQPQALSEFLTANRALILAQSLAFVSSAVVMLGFLGVLRDLLAESGRASTAATIMFGAGAVGYGMNILGQAPQITLTLPTETAITPSTAGVLADLGYALLALANAPITVMFAAAGYGILRSRVMPAWLGWIAVAAAGASALLTFAVVTPTGALAPQGWLSYALYPIFIVWLASTGVTLLRTPGEPAGAPSRPARAYSGQRSG